MEGGALHKRVLRRCCNQLIEDLDFMSIVDYLTSKEVFPATRIRNIKEEKYTTDKVRALLENIEKADPSVYKIFLSGLKETGQDHLRELLLGEEKKMKSEKLQKKGKQTTDKVTGAAENQKEPDGRAENKRQTSAPLKDVNCTSSNAADTTVRPKDTHQEIGKSNEEIIAETQKYTASQRETPLRGDNVTDNIQPTFLRELGSVNGKEPHHKGSMDMVDAPTPVIDELRDLQDSNWEKAKANEFLDTTQTAESNTISQNASRGSNNEPNCYPVQTVDSDTSKPFQSLGSLSSYADIHTQSISGTISSLDKEQHYKRDPCNEPPAARPNQSQSGNICTNQSTTVLDSSGAKLNEKTSQISRGQEADTVGLNITTPIGLVQCTDSTSPPQPEAVDPIQVSEPLPSPAISVNSTKASSQPNNTADISSLEDEIAALDTSEEHNFLREHFDASVIYTQSYSNRADEMVDFLRSLSGDYKVCYYDDYSYFGLFTPARQPEVLCRHCVLHLVLVSDNLDDDKDAKGLRDDITMLKKTSSQIVTVLFSKEELKHIPESLVNTNKIHWYDEAKKHAKRKLDALLSQCKGIRKKREDQGVKSEKDIMPLTYK